VYDTVSLAVFAEERSCASIAFPSFSFLVSTYKCTSEISLLRIVAFGNLGADFVFHAPLPLK